MAYDPIKLSVKDSTFAYNTAEVGAAILVYNGIFTIENCIFNNNKATDYGGAVFISANESFVVNILDSTFNGNSARECSAIYIYDAKGNIKNNNFINNKASSDDISGMGVISSNCVLENNIIKSNANLNENLKIQFLTTPQYYGDIFQVKFTKNGSPLKNKKIVAEAYKTLGTSSIKFNFVTDSNGIAKLAFTSDDLYMDVGQWDVHFVADSGSSKIAVSKHVNIKKLSSKVIVNALTTTFASGKVLSVKLVNKATNTASANVRLFVTIYKNGYFYKDFKIKTNLNGVSSVKLANLPVGKYKFEINKYEISNVMSLAKTSVLVKINKAPTKVKAPKVTYKYKKSKFFKVTVKAYNKPVKSLKVKIKVYTGKKYKTYTIKTDKKGVAKLNTKKLKKGSHKVVIASGNVNYKISTKSKIIIK